jgi:hypothetical protein
MKLFEMSELPRTAGRAILKFGAEERMHLERDGKEITLPGDPEMDFFPLMEGQQFLVRKNITDRDSGRYETAVWFGGTDENPFLVRLDPQVFTTFSRFTSKQRGKQEEVFKESLKPTAIKALEIAFGVRALRQGDIFACPLPFKIDALQGAALALRMGNVTINHDAEKVSLFRTRHSITGTLGTFERHQNDRDRSTVVGVGVLRAPDHQPLELKTPHILEQAEYLYEPAKAD